MVNNSYALPRAIVNSRTLTGRKWVRSGRCSILTVITHIRRPVFAPERSNKALGVCAVSSNNAETFHNALEKLERVEDREVLVRTVRDAT